MKPATIAPKPTIARLRSAHGGGFMHARRLIALTVLTAAALAAAPVRAASLSAANSYTVHALVSDTGVDGSRTDINLVNGWGITASATSPWWVANNHTDTSTLYRGDGAIVPLVVSVPGGPTGTVFNGSSTLRPSARRAFPVPR